jgi:hypothetical protein
MPGRARAWRASAVSPTMDEHAHAPRRAALAGVAVLFIALTALITYPQVRVFRSAIIAEPQGRADAYLSMWRLGWVAHQLPRDPRHLFDANIFFPELRTFAFTDAMLLPSVAAAPLVWLGAGLITAHNVTLLGALALSGLTMFLLARSLTGNSAAGIAAGVIFAFGPFRIEQYDHVEVEMAFWLPLILLVLHRTLKTGRLRDGMLLGMLVALQALSGLYDAIFFVTYLIVLGPLVAWADGVPRIRHAAGALAAGGIIAAAIVLIYVQPFLKVHQVLGDQSIRETIRYSATWSSFLASPASNRLYGWTAARFGGQELNLFPGLIAAGLAAAGAFAARPRMALAYALAMCVAVELSLGFNGSLYPWLYARSGLFRGLRVPARFDLDVMLSLAVLAAIGLAHILTRCPSLPRRSALVAVALVGIVAEYASAPVLAPASRQPSAVDRWLTGQPRVVLLELPFAPVDRSNDSLYMYEGRTHWQPMLNGYSGFFPQSYLDLMSRMTTFDDASIAYLRERHVDYIVLRERMYDPGPLQALRAQLSAREDVALVGSFANPQDPRLDALVYVIRK